MNKKVRYIRKKSQRQESRTAEEFGGRTQIASGALDGMKADVKTGDNTVGFKDADFLIENKFTDKASFSIQKKIWAKIEEEAMMDGLRIPILQVDIQDTQLVVMGKEDFLSLLSDAVLNK